MGGGLEPGIYFGLEDQAYHADKALGSSSIKEIVLDPIEFQWNRKRGEEKDSAAMVWGSALHARALEGREAFSRKFVRSPIKADYPGCLITADDLRAHLQGLSLKAGKTKSEMISLIRTVDTETVIWDEVTAKFEADCGTKRTPISAAIAEQIETAAQWMQQDALLSPLMQDGTFWAGAPEVSIFYEDDGVRLKLRLDRLLPHAILDLKSFRSQQPKMAAAVIRAIASLRYDLQAAAYIRGWRAARELYEKGLVFGADDRERELLKLAFETGDAMKWIWIFVKNSGAPQAIVRELSLDSFLFKGSLAQVDDAIIRYRELTAEFGEDADWIPSHPADIITEQDMPPWALQ